MELTLNLLQENELEGNSSLGIKPITHPADYHGTSSYKLPNQLNPVPNGYNAKFENCKWCPGAELNHRRRPFQGLALPLSYPGNQIQEPYSTQM
jgi:hypothetical protein